MSYSEEDERKAHIENMEADTRYKVTLTRIEPWKTIIAALIAVAAIFGFLGYKIGSQPVPAPIVIQVPAPAPQPAAH
jgi:hypothetical protein